MRGGAGMKDNSKEFENIEGPIVAYKAFDKDFCCHGKQYEVGKSYHTDVDVKSLSKGFYGFIRPIDAIMIYKLEVCSRFAVVEFSGTVIKYDDNLYEASDMKIISEIDLFGLMRMVWYALKSRKTELVSRGKYFYVPNCVLKDNVKLPLFVNEQKIYVIGKNSMLASMGERCEVLFEEGSVVSGMGVSHKITSIAIDAKIMTSGDVSYIESYGERSQLCNMGDFCKMFVAGTDTYLLNSGNNCSIISAGKDINISDCGFGTFIASYGDNASISVTGDATHVLSTGDNARIVVTGDDSYVNCYGKNVVIIVIGKNCAVRAKNWTDVYVADNRTVLGKQHSNPVVSASVFVTDDMESDKWYVFNDGKIEECKR